MDIFGHCSSILLALAAIPQCETHPAVRTHGSSMHIPKIQLGQAASLDARKCMAFSQSHSAIITYHSANVNLLPVSALGIPELHWTPHHASLFSPRAYT